jgi:hypothetical protein
MLLAAYHKQGNLGLPVALAETVACLLGRDGLLDSMDDVTTGRFIFVDHPELAGAAAQQAALIGFYSGLDNRPEVAPEFAWRNCASPASVTQVMMVAEAFGCGNAWNPRWWTPFLAVIPPWEYRIEDFEQFGIWEDGRAPTGGAGSIGQSQESGRKKPAGAVRDAAGFGSARSVSRAAGLARHLRHGPGMAFACQIGCRRATGRIHTRPTGAFAVEESVGGRCSRMKSATTLTELELPWNRIERLQKAAGIPLAASVQWELCRDTLARGPLAAYQQLLWEAAQGDLLHNDDTHMRVLKWAANAKKGEPLREDAPGRSGVFTTSVLSVSPQRPTIALFFTGVAHCLNHARRNFVDLADSMIP